MIYIFPRTATPTELLSNGLGRLDCTACTVYEEINADFYCELTVPISGANAENFVGGAIVRVPTHRGLQYFRLAMPEQNLTEIRSKAWHISYDLHSDMILNTSISAKTGAQAIALLLAAGVTETRFTGTSDITTVTNMKAVRCSILSAIMDAKQNNSFVNRWGGEVERNNFVFNVRISLGTNNGVRIVWKRNLTGFDMKEDWSTIVTRIVPTCLKDNDVSLSLPEVYVDSARISDYPRPVMRAIHFSDIKVGQEVDGAVPYPTEASAFTEMRNRCAAYYAAGIDLPNVSANISLADLSKTVEYKDFVGLETINLGDTVTGAYRDTVITRRVRAITYDGLDERIDKVTLGDASKNIVASKLYAQDIDLSVLNTAFANTIKQGEKYYEASITHDDGFRVDGSTSLNGGYAKFNADEMGFFDASNNMVGGFAYTRGMLAMIANLLTDDATDPAFWARVGQVADGIYTRTGILGYASAISTTESAFSFTSGGAVNNPFFKFLFGPFSAYFEYFPDTPNNNFFELSCNGTRRVRITGAGNFSIYDPGGVERVKVAASGELAIKDAAGVKRMWSDSIDSGMSSPNGNNIMWIDNVNAYKRIGGTQSIL